MPENIPLTDILSGGTNSLRTEVTNIPAVTNANIDIALSALRDAITKTGETVKTLADVVDKLSDVGVTSLPSLIAGSDIVGKFGIDQTTGGTTNGIVNKNASGIEIFTDANPASIKLTGRKLALAVASYNQVLNVSAGGNTVITITPPVGELWRVKNLYFSVPAIGATSGTHSIHVYTGSIDINEFINLYGAYTGTLTLKRNVKGSGTSVPTNDAEVQRAILNMVITNSLPLSIKYSNLTDVAQTGTIAISVVREVEYIV